MAIEPVKSVLFVYTGNIFRSLVAKPQSIHLVALARHLDRGIDPASHVQRKVTQSLLEQADCIVAMGRDHQEVVERLFGLSIPLFNQLCFDRNEPILDVRETLPDWEQNLDRAQGYVRSVVDHIWDAIPHFAARLPHL